MVSTLINSCPLIEMGSVWAKTAWPISQKPTTNRLFMFDGFYTVIY